MIPNEQQCKALWDKYQLPEKKRVHVTLVAKVAMFLAEQCRMKNVECKINTELLLAGALLHDLDKNVRRLPGEKHPETVVRILRAEGMVEVANLIKYHSVQFIGDKKIAPKTFEEKLLFLADKMVGHEVITVDRRFELWLSEDDLPENQKAMLHEVYPKVKALEKEIFDLIGIAPQDVAQLVGA